MKAFTIIMKVLVALAAVAGAVFVIATYGDKIVAKAKELLHRCHHCDGCLCDDDDIEQEDKIIIMKNGTIKVPADAVEEDDVPAEAAEEDCACDAPAEEAEEAPAAPAADEDAVVADDNDFEA